MLKCCRTQQFFTVMLDEPVQIFSSQRTIGDHAHIVGSVANFPRFADGDAWRQRLLIEPLEFAATPEPFLKERLEC